MAVTSAKTGANARRLIARASCPVVAANHNEKHQGETSLTDAREFALEVVQRLRSAGFIALWAGGCVRDLLMEREPHDYDVATSATPQQVRELFGFRRTLMVGLRLE